jgi:alanine-glyoxylate transaminase/serine-glyoxylate transaminase/serine-pyruvate transaminase
MIPGPVPLSDGCMAELQRPVEAHYGSAWAELYHETVGLMQVPFGTVTADVFLIVGSGSTGLEAAIGSLTNVGDRVLVGVNGYFGERLVAIARGLGTDPLEVPAAWGEPIDPAELDTALSGSPEATAVLVTHVETSTGVSNPVPEIAAVAREHGVPIVVDAVSSLGGMRVAMDTWGIDVCVSATQKCLGAPAGLAPVAVSQGAWPRMERRRSPRGWYLDLLTWRLAASRDRSWHPHPVTMPTTIVRALHRALRELDAEGINRRAARLAALAARLRLGLRSLGLQPLADDRWAAPVVTAFRPPPALAGADMVEYVERVHGIRIAGSPGSGTQDLVRVGHMAPIVSERDIDDVLVALEGFLAQLPGWAPVTAAASSR